MESKILKLIDVTILFIQFMTSVHLIVLTATGAAFYYYWTTQQKGEHLRKFWPFSLPAAFVLTAFIFIGYLYSHLCDTLARFA